MGSSGNHVTPDQPELTSGPSTAATPFPAGHAVPQIVIQSSGSRLSRFFSWLGWAGLLVCLPFLVTTLLAFRDYFDTSQGIRERYVALSQTAKDKVAMITIRGAILEGDGFVKKQINRVRNDPAVKGVVVRINSPGGSVSASDYIYHHLKKLREERKLPVVVSMGDMAASGGYYVAMAVGDQEESIFAEPTTTTGSIGVIIPHYDLSGLLAKLSISNESIASHPRKQMLSMTRPLTAENREILERYLEAAFRRFKKVVLAGRPAFKQNEALLKEVATGEIFSADQALEKGLVDRIGFVEDAIERVVELAGLDANAVRVVNYRQSPTILGSLGVANGNPASTPSIWDLTVPKAYYLLTTLPALLHNETAWPEQAGVRATWLTPPGCETSPPA